MSLGIYCYIDTKDNSIVYIGKDSNMDKKRRNKDHFASCNYNQQQINRVLQNNPTRYAYQVLAWNVTDQDTLNALEISYIAEFNPKFNFTDGGEGMVGYKHSEEAKQKMSKSKKGKYVGENNPFYGKKHSQKTKQRISKSKKGQTLSEETRKKMSEAHKGKTLSEETRKKMSENNARHWKDKNFSKNHRLKMSKAHNQTGFYCVSKVRCKECKNGFNYWYRFVKDGKRIKFTAVDIVKLEQKIKNKGLPWGVVDKERAQKTIEENERLYPKSKREE